MQEWIQIVTATIGAVGFAIFFHVDKAKLPVIALGGFLSWTIYLFVFHQTESVFTSNFISALLLAILSEVMARRMKAPANIFLVPFIITLLPGANLYYSMSALIMREMDVFQMNAVKTLVITSGIVAGVVVGFYIFFYSSQFMQYVGQRK